MALVNCAAGRCGGVYGLAAAAGKTRLGAFALAALAGILTRFPPLIKETPCTFVLFMFVAQPLLAAAFLLFALKVFRDLRSGHLF